VSADCAPEQRAAERLAAALGLTVRAQEPERRGRRWRASVTILNAGARVDGAVSDDADDPADATGEAWRRALSALRSRTAGALPSDARHAAICARARRRELSALALAVGLAREALAAAEAAHAKAVALDAAARAALDAHRPVLPEDARAVLDALTEAP